MSTVFQIYKGRIFDGILFPNPIWDIFGEVFNNCFKKSSVVLEHLQNKPLEHS